MNRVNDSSYDDRCERFTYDKVGNRLTKTTNDITEKYVYNIKNQLKELHNKNGINYFTHDKQGNTIKEETTTGNNIFEYNTLNQQVKAITKEGNTLVSRYDTDGLRAEIEENEKLTKFIFHKENVLVETDKDYNSISRFTRGYEVVAADISDLDGNSNSEIESKLDRHYYTVDEQGSTIFITDKNQSVKNQYHYDAFGNVLDSKEDVHNRITYTGQQFDGITGQYYLRARFYNPVIGRFTQEDTYRGDGLNLYAYCGNNPVGYWDPSGYSSINKESAFGEMSDEDAIKYNTWNKLRSEGLDQQKINDIILTNKEFRYDSSTYLSKNYIDEHLKQFNNGGSFVMTKEQYMRFVEGNPYIGCPDNTQFIAPKDFMDEIGNIAKGDISVYEKKLGFDDGHFSSGGGLVRFDVKNPDKLNLRIPSGNEIGANEHWIPGGYTDGGTAEVVVNNIPNNIDYVDITFLN